MHYYTTRIYLFRPLYLYQYVYVIQFMCVSIPYASKYTHGLYLSMVVSIDSGHMSWVGLPPCWPSILAFRPIRRLMLLRASICFQCTLWSSRCFTPSSPSIAFRSSVQGCSWRRFRIFYIHASFSLDWGNIPSPSFSIRSCSSKLLETNNMGLFSWCILTA